MTVRPKEPVKFPPIQIPPQMGDLIREVRLDLGYTQAALARFAGISQSTLSDIEAGVQTNPRPETLRKIEGPLGFVSGFLAEGFEEERQALRPAPRLSGNPETDEAFAQIAKAQADLRRVTAERDAALKAEHETARQLKVALDALRVRGELVDVLRVKLEPEVEGCISDFWRGAVTGAVAMLAALIISALAVLL